MTNTPKKSPSAFHSSKKNPGYVHVSRPFEDGTFAVVEPKYYKCKIADKKNVQCIYAKDVVIDVDTKCSPCCTLDAVQSTVAGVGE